MSGSWPGCEIRTLPDGGRDFILTEPKLSFIRIDMQSRLQFGEAQLEIETPFTLTTTDGSYELDPGDRAGLGPLLSLYPDQIVHLMMRRDGTLDATFASGSVLTVKPHPKYEAWNIAGFWCAPGGFE
jgi:hypothetical protein